MEKLNGCRNNLKFIFKKNFKYNRRIFKIEESLKTNIRILKNKYKNP